MLSEFDVRDILTEFDAAFGRPFNADDTVRVGTWKRALNGNSEGDSVAPDEARYAVGILAKHGEKYPTPKAVRSLCFQHRTRKLLATKQQTERNDEPIPYCPRCYSRTLITDPWGRYRPRHADNCPGLHPDDLEIQRLSLARERLNPEPLAQAGD